MSTWGFLYKRQREVILWLLVVKHSPYIPIFFDEYLKRHIASFLSYPIYVDMSDRFKFGGKWLNERHRIYTQRQAIRQWMTSNLTIYCMGRRLGKSTLARAIPQELFVLIVVVCQRQVSHFRHIYCGVKENITIITVDQIETVNLQRYDFVFGEEVGKTYRLISPHNWSLFFVNFFK